MIEFKHLKEYATASGSVITMKSLVTIKGTQYVHCYENDTRYPAAELTEVVEIEPGITEII